MQKFPSDRIKIDDILSLEFFQLPYPKLCPPSTLYQAPKELPYKLGTGRNSVVPPNRAKSVAQFRKTAKSIPKFIDATDEDIAKENLDKDGKL